MTQFPFDLSILNFLPVSRKFLLSFIRILLCGESLDIPDKSNISFLYTIFWLAFPDTSPYNEEK